jgi:predicted nucleic acid-binding protein
MQPAVEILLADADVLIDYRDSALTILKLVAEHIGPVRVLREVLDEAPGISDRQCARLGIEIVQLETELMLEVNSLLRSLSVIDRLCVVACEHNSWTLVTNDRPLRSVCKDRGIHLRWGLGLMIDLVHTEVLTEARALKIAATIQRANPTHITAGLIDRFRARMRER